MRLALGLSFAALLGFAGCGDDDGPTTDAGGDVGTSDGGGMDTGGDDAGADDAGGDDAGGDDAGGDDGGDVDAGPTTCDTDSDCTSGEQWCVGGECVECDNSGLLCDIACTDGWTTYMRNGCSPCECAPTNECTSDDDCEGGTCYPGEFCWDWCPDGDPSCCFGNRCVAGGCEGPPPSGCFERGCPQGASCQTTGECVPSACSCDPDSGAWICTSDCGGGSCVLPD